MDTPIDPGKGPNPVRPDEERLPCYLIELLLNSTPTSAARRWDGRKRGDPRSEDVLRA